MPCDAFIDALRQRGYRITPQRAVIIQALAHTEGHQTAEEIYTRVHDQSSYINIATVYRTLEMLVNEGLACRSDLGDGQVVYTPYQHGPHIHLVCRQCGAVISAEPGLLEALDDALRQQHGFTADLGHISLPGLCAACRAERQELPAPTLDLKSNG